jgi:hypothetical protein
VISEWLEKFDEVRKDERYSKILTYPNGVYFSVFPDYERKRDLPKHSDCPLFPSLKYYPREEDLAGIWMFWIDYQCFVIDLCFENWCWWRKSKKIERITIPPKNVTVWPVSDTTWVMDCLSAPGLARYLDFPGQIARS